MPLCLHPPSWGVLMLREQGQQLVSKEAMKAYGAAVKAAVDARVARLADADLTSIQERVSKKIGRELSYGAVMVMLASHTMYHLGSCDAALRDHGLPGVF